MCSSEYLPILEVGFEQEFYNETKEEILFKVNGYEKSFKNEILFHICGIIFIGVPYLLMFIIPKLKLHKYKHCDLANATIILGKKYCIQVI